MPILRLERQAERGPFDHPSRHRVRVIAGAPEGARRHGRAPADAADEDHRRGPPGGALAARAERPPTRQTKTTGVSRWMVSAWAVSSPSATWRAPAMRPASHS